MSKTSSPVPYIGKEGFKCVKTVTFSSTPAASITLFNVTGEVFTSILAVCTTNVVGTTGADTLSVGTTANLTAILPATIADDIDARDIWKDTVVNSEIESTSDALRSFIITDGNDIVMMPSNIIVSGVITFYCYWTPISDDSIVVSN